nr:AbiH family protein [uncultured Draconibacterium sp.]
MKINKDNSIEFDHEYDAVLIIGNGFDLNYNLPTRYSDFIKTHHFENLIKEENQFAKYLKGKEQLENWIDIENELKTYASLKKSDKTNFFEEFKNISKSLTTYLSEIKLTTVDKTSTGYRFLEQLRNADTLIIDFNYTDTISTLLNELKTGDGHRFDHVKIHGSIADDNIIFGVEDKARLAPEHVFLKKSVNKNFKAVDFNYQLNNCHFLGIFGHSLGETDHMYFDDFFQKECLRDDDNKRDILIFHYGEKSYYDIFSQLDTLTLKRISKLKKLNKLRLIDTKNNSR